MLSYVLPPEEGEHIDPGIWADALEQSNKDGSLMLLGERAADKGTPVLA